MKIKTCKSLLILFFLSSLISCNALKKTQIKEEKPKNIILMIGDGMGLAQITAALIEHGNSLNMLLLDVVGLIQTSSASDFITDSAAGATAFSSGVKTYNGAIGVNNDSLPVKTILEIAESFGMSTGLVATSSITHATPAAFYAHQPSRKLDLFIANDLYNSSIDVIIGGGKMYFNDDSLAKYNYDVRYGIQSISNYQVKSDIKFAGFWHKDSTHCPIAENRGYFLPMASKKAIDILKTNKKGFFLMIEGSQIDWGGHANDQNYITTELIDFDNAVKEVLEYVKQDGETLLIITADHETGGMALNGGNIKNKTIQSYFTTKQHTGIMVPVFATGPGSKSFSGTYQNTDIFFKMLKYIEKTNLK